MESRKIELTLEQAREFYRQGGKLKELALSAYSAEELQGNIMDRIKTFGDAVEELGEKHEFVREYNIWVCVKPTHDVLAYLKLRIICATLNEGWEPKFIKGEWRYVPYFYSLTNKEWNNKSEEWKKENNAVLFGGDTYYGSYAGFVCAGSDSVPSGAYACEFGSRLCLKSSELAIYCGKQFADIWADYLLIRK